MASWPNSSFLLLTLYFVSAFGGGHSPDQRCSLPEPPIAEAVACADPIEGSLNKLSGERFSGAVIIPTNTTLYESVIKQYASVTHFDRVRPSIVVQALTESDVQAAVHYARQCKYDLSVRSGGHSYLALSSCSGETPCLQIDVGMMRKMDVVQASGQLVVGPGNRLEDLAEKLEEYGLFLPTGECAKVGLGGHVQTGGFGMWSRQFGALAYSVSSFRIVLADGSVNKVTTPTVATSRLNDDLFFAVLGGASGSWGVVTEITLDAVAESAYFSAYWNVKLVWNTEGVANMFRRWSELAETKSDDLRWSTHWTVVGAQPAGYPNYIEFEASWVAPVDQAAEYDPAFFQTILDACTNCIVFESVNVTEPMSASLKNRYMTAEDGPEFPAPFRHYKKSWQQSSHIPNPDETEAIVRKVDSYLPNENSTYLLVGQLSTGATNGPEDDALRSLPWPDSKFGVACDFFYPDPRMAPIFDDWLGEFTRLVIEKFDGEDRRMYWGAYNDPDISVDWPKYFESEDKFKTLKDIKACVDPTDIFTHAMSMPVGELPDDVQPENSMASLTRHANWFFIALVLMLRARV